MRRDANLSIAKLGIHNDVSPTVFYRKNDVETCVSDKTWEGRKTLETSAKCFW